jgi:2',3'-cyclic-nucleotide 2'-phosphodiesterase (5'-nucleotidase family)
MSQNLISLLAAVLLLTSCSHSKTGGNVDSQDSTPEHAFQSADPNQETIAIVALNDFHGTLLPKERKLPDGRVVKSGGAEALASMVKILREEMNGYRRCGR